MVLGMFPFEVELKEIQGRVPRSMEPELKNLKTMKEVCRICLARIRIIRRTN